MEWEKRREARGVIGERGREGAAERGPGRSIVF